MNFLTLWREGDSVVTFLFWNHYAWYLAQFRKMSYIGSWYSDTPCLVHCRYLGLESTSCIWATQEWDLGTNYCILCIFLSVLLPRKNQVLLIVAELEVCFRLILIPQMIRGFSKCLCYQGFGGFPRGELVKGSTVEIWLCQSVGVLWKVASCMQIVVDDPWTNGMPSFS